MTMFLVLRVLHILLAAVWVAGGVLTLDDRRYVAGLFRFSPRSLPCQAVV